MRGLVVALLVLWGAVSAPATAWAQKRRKVEIKTNPAGATVFVGDSEDAERGVTPMVIELPLGDVSVRIVKDTFEPLPVTIRVDKPRRGERGKPQRVEYNLLEAIGTLTIEGPAGAEVLIDGEVVGAAPGSFDVVAGGHRVELRVDGELGEMEFADVAVGETRTVRLSGPGAGGANAGGGDEPGGVGAGGGEGDVGGEVRAVRPASPRTTPLVVAHAVYQFDARSFTYQGLGNMSPLITLTSSYFSMLGVAVEAYPARATGVRALHPLSLTATYLVGLPTEVDPGPTSLSRDNPPRTFAQTIEVGARYRAGLGATFALDLDAGYGRYQYQFSGQNDDIDRLPDLVYSTVRIGGRLVARLGRAEAYLGGENRIVLSGGPELDQKFPAGRSADGYGARVGGSLALGSWLRAAVEGGLVNYGWTFTSDAGDMFEADGGTDRVMTVSALVGGAY
ncbi:MAG: PEGA domain-containing protein [Kofleriaceae bacterium]|jgi:hypothetical protein|nr:PEGA domain-containing protein [Kofleriaceae bacterium]